jgi:hypothetical protein
LQALRTWIAPSSTTELTSPRKVSVMTFIPCLFSRRFWGPIGQLWLLFYYMSKLFLSVSNRTKWITGKKLVGLPTLSFRGTPLFTWIIQCLLLKVNMQFYQTL